MIYLTLLPIVNKKTMRLNIMLIIVVLLSLLILAGCSKNYEIGLGDSIKDTRYIENRHISLNSLYVFNFDDRYTVVIEENEFVSKTVTFMTDRSFQNVRGITPVNIEKIENFLGENFSKAEEVIGSSHCDTGSGFFIPTYITDDAHIVFFYIENDIIIGVTKIDIITNSIVEKVEQ